MLSTFSGIELGKRSLIAHTEALQTTGHNLSNVATEGYSRQRVELKPFDPIYFPGLNRSELPGQIGQGVAAERVERIRDVLLEGRIVAKANDQGYWSARDKYLLMVEQVYNEPTDHSVRALLDKFWESWQELSVYPNESAARKAVIQRGEALLAGIHDQRHDKRGCRRHRRAGEFDPLGRRRFERTDREGEGHRRQSKRSPRSSRPAGQGALESHRYHRRQS